MIKRILVPLDGSKNSVRGLEHAIILARNCKATILGIFVIENFPNRSDKYPEKKVLEKAEKFLEKAKVRAAKKGILLESKISFGAASETIVKFATARRFDLIVIGSRGNSGLKEIFLGSVSNHVVHKSKIPVVLVK